MKLQLIVVLLSFAVLTGCLKKDQTKEKPLYPSTVIGVLSPREVAELATKINALHFPLPPGSVERMLPSEIVPEHWSVSDAFVTGSLGRAGGRILDYWLNDDFILRVAQGYYPKSEWGSKDEWAVVIRSDERRTHKAPYPTYREPNHTAEPASPSTLR